MIVQPFRIKAIVRVILWTSIWINISEVFRYFSIVRPNIQRFFNHQEGIAAMDWIIFSIWGAWDMLLTTMVVLTCWLFINILGNNRKSIVLAQAIQKRTKRKLHEKVAANTCLLYTSPSPRDS